MGYSEWLHKRVTKKDGTPFKSGYLSNTVKGVGVSSVGFRHKYTFIFVEDNSEVQCDYCELVPSP